MRLVDDQQLCPSDQPFRKLIAGGGSANVEFGKSLGGGATERVEAAACAFATDLPGTGRAGIVIVGLADDGSLVGGRVTDSLLRDLGSIRTDGNIGPPRPSTSRSDPCVRGASGRNRHGSGRTHPDRETTTWQLSVRPLADSKHNTE